MSRWAHPVRILAGPALFALLFVVPLPDLGLEGGTVVATRTCRAVLGLTAWMAVWWMTEALPLAATSLLPLLVLPVAGVSPARDVAGTYFDDTVALFLGGFLLALGMEKSGLHLRLAGRVLRLFGERPRRIVLGFLAASALVSMWVSNSATALMLMPVAVSVAGAGRGPDPARWAPPERNFAAACVLAVAFGASIGGVGTLVGTPPNMLLRRTWETLARGRGTPDLTFERWMAIGVPVVIVLVPLAWWILTRLAIPVPARLEAAAERREADVDPGRVRFAESVVLGTFLATAFAWITHAPIEIGGRVLPFTGWDDAFRFGGSRSYVSDATIAIAAGLLLFVLPSREAVGDRVLTWDYVHARLPWGSLLLFGGGFALAGAFRPSGLDAYLRAAFAGLHGVPPLLLTGVVVGGVAMASEVASNTAIAAMILPILASVAVGAGMDPGPLLIAGTLGASAGYALPVATPPNTIAYGTGLVTVRQMGRAGVILDLVAIAVFTAAATWIAPAVLQ